MTARSILTGLALLLLAGCGGGSSTVTPTPATPTSAGTTNPAAAPTPTGSKECRDLAAAVRVARLAGPTPTEEVAEQVAESLDAKLSRLSAKVHDPAVDLHGHLHDLAAAQRRGRTERADQLADRARTDATNVAKACGVPAAEFLGTA